MRCNPDEKRGDLRRLERRASGGFVGLKLGIEIGCPFPNPVLEALRKLRKLLGFVQVVDCKTEKGGAFTHILKNI